MSLTIHYYRNTTTFHALLSITETIIGRSESARQQELAKLMFNRLLEGVKELGKYWSAAKWAYSMWSDLVDKHFMALKAAVKNAANKGIVYQPFRSQSRVPSRFGTPLPTTNAMLMRAYGNNESTGDGARDATLTDSNLDPLNPTLLFTDDDLFDFDLSSLSQDLDIGGAWSFDADSSTI